MDIWKCITILVVITPLLFLVSCSSNSQSCRCEGTHEWPKVSNHQALLEEQLYREVDGLKLLSEHMRKHIEAAEIDRKDQIKLLLYVQSIEDTSISLRKMHDDYFEDMSSKEN